MKKLFYLCMLLSCALWSCDKNNDRIEPEDATLKISVADLVFEAKGGTLQFNITCNTDWTITNGSEWVKTNISSGKENKTVTVTTEAYSGLEDRDKNLTIKAGDKTKVLTVTQKHKNAIILSKGKLDVPREGGKVAIETKSDFDYQVTVPAKFQSWIKQTPESRATTKKFTFAISANDSTDYRSGYIIFSGNALNDTVRVFQTQKNRLILTEDTYNIPEEGKVITVELKTNIDYEVKIPETAKAWVSQTETKASRTDRLTFRIAANENKASRSVKITVKDKNSTLSDTIQISQDAKGAKYTGDVVFRYVDDLVKFREAGHTKVTGSVSVLLDNIKTLQPLGNLLVEIGGSLILDCHTLTSLEGLGKLKKVAGNVVVTKGSFTYFEGLQNLETIGGNCTVSPSGSSLTALQSFGLTSLKSIGGNFEVSASSLNALESFEGLENLQSIGKDFSCNKNISSKGLNGLNSVGGNLSIYVFSEGLKNLVSVGGDFNLCGNPSKNLGKLTDLGGNLNIDNFYGASFEGLENLKIEFTKWRIGSCPYLKSFKGLNWVKNIEGDFVVDSHKFPALESFEGLENLQTIGGNFTVSASSSDSKSLTALKSFKGLSGLKSIGKDFEVYASNSLPALESFEGLENLQTIGGNFKVSASTSTTTSSYYSSYSLDALKSFKGLSGLKSIGGDFEVSASSYSISFCSSSYSSSYSSHSLTDLESFEGLENLQTIGGNFTVSSSSKSSCSSYYHSSDSYSYSLTDLKSFKGLSGLKSIGGNFTVSASSSTSFYIYVSTSTSSHSLDALKSFEGLENLQTIGGNFKVSASSSSPFSFFPSSSSSLTALTNFCSLSNALKNLTGTFSVTGCPYNPTKEQILSGKCSK